MCPEGKREREKARLGKIKVQAWDKGPGTLLEEPRATLGAQKVACSSPSFARQSAAVAPGSARHDSGQTLTAKPVVTSNAPCSHVVITPPVHMAHMAPKPAARGSSQVPSIKASARCPHLGGPTASTPTAETCGSSWQLRLGTGATAEQSAQTPPVRGCLAALPHVAAGAAAQRSSANSKH